MISRAQRWRWYGEYLARQRGPLVAATLMGGALALATLPILWLIRFALDEAIPRGETAMLVAAAAGVLLLRLAVAGAVVTATRPIASRLRRVTAMMRNDLVARLHRLNRSDWLRLESARAHGRIVHETERIEQMTAALFQSAIPAVLPLLAYVGVLLHLSWPLTLLTFAVAVPARLATWLAARRLRHAIGRFQQSFEAFHLVTRRVLTMLTASRVQATEADAVRDHRVLVERLGHAGGDMAVASAANAQAMAFSSALVVVAVLLAGGILVAAGDMTLGALVAFLMAATQVNAALGSLTASIPALFAGDEALLRLAELHFEGREDDVSGTLVPDFGATLSLHGVGFGYEDTPLFAGVAMDIVPGEVTVVAAANGAGKTSLFELMLGLWTPGVGTIRLGEDDVATLDPARYRGAIGVLPQHPVMFRGTIRQNILFGREEIAAADALADALHRAALNPLLTTLPDGLDTQVGDDGQFFSGGERQRIALARALVHRPRLLMLDEPSNHLDDMSMALIIDRLLTAPDRPTCVIATHDPRLMAIADRIYELANGQMRLRPRVLRSLAS